MVFQGAIHGQTIRKMDFRNQNISDILMVLADMGKQSIIIDPSVTGTATFYFSDSEFEEALYQFTDACNLFCEKRNNAYYVSKMRISMVNDLVTVLAEDVEIETLIKSISRSIEKTILYDPLPRASISIHSQQTELKDLLEIIIKKYADYSVVEESGAFYVKRSVESPSSSPSRLGSNAIRKNGELYSMEVQRASFSAIITLLFRTAEKEYSLLQRIDSTLENLYFHDKPFDQLLRLILEQGNCDYVESGNIYYIHEVQRRDVLKNFKRVMVIQMQNIPVEEASGLLPSDYSGSSFLKINKNTNSVYLTGSTEEIQPIADFLQMLDVPVQNKTFTRFEVQFLKVSDFLSLLPKELAAAGPLVIPETNAFVVQVSEEMTTKYNNYIELIDKKNIGTPVYLRYIKSEELIQNLPPSAQKEDIIVSSDSSLIFYQGTDEKRNQFMEHLKLIDQPKPQIRYQLLVIQYQRSDNLNWNKSVTVNSPESEGAENLVSGTFSNLLNISFDIVSGLGTQLAGQLNLQLGEDKAKVLADTTLNALSGQDVKFENTNTFRYRDTTIDPETGKPFYTGVTREITSGLVLGINGWVSGDGMITMKVNAAVSKQDESGANTSATTNPPPTSERVVNTQVRTKSGTPIIIGGLLQIEKSEQIQKTPFLGSIPLIGRLFRDMVTSEITTEMVIYIVPYIHHGENTSPNYAKRSEEYYKKYVLRQQS
jgi:type II secretory pathway component GspD/PulD (secretin)